MKKPDFKKVLVFSTIALLLFLVIVYSIDVSLFDSADENNFSMSRSIDKMYDVVLYSLIVQGVLYIVLGINDLAKDSIKSGVLDIICGVILFKTFNFMNDYFYRYLIRIIEWSIVAIAISTINVIICRKKGTDGRKIIKTDIIFSAGIFGICFFIFVVGLVESRVINNINYSLLMKNFKDESIEEGAYNVSSSFSMDKYKKWLSHDLIIKSDEGDIPIDIYFDSDYKECYITNGNKEILSEVKAKGIIPFLSFEDAFFDGRYAMELFYRAKKKEKLSFGYMFIKEYNDGKIRFDEKGISLTD